MKDLLGIEMAGKINGTDSGDRSASSAFGGIDFVNGPGEVIDWFIRLGFPTGDLRFDRGKLSVISAGGREKVIPPGVNVFLKDGLVDWRRLENSQEGDGE